MSRSVKGVLGLKKLIIVESPTKARTISAFLGKEYLVLSSQGHVRDLPKKDLGVDIENDFTPKFETKRTKQVKLLRDAAKGAQAIYLATDHDREGEAIAYDLYTILKRVVPDESAFSRPVFNEITKRVILEALKSPSQIDLNKVEAQRTRRILDRLVGYQVSPLLSRIIAGSKYEGLSAGRVQSVALRFLCDREAEIASFVPKEYWEISVELSDSGTFVASLTKKDGKKFVVRSAGEAEAVEAELRAARIAVKAVEEKERLRQPPPPFITSSMQQAASSTLGFSPKRTMRVAQELYEGVALPDGTTGLITYMRTDSVRMSDEAIGQARKLIERNFGKEYLAEKPRRYRNKKRSQDAHEAIRPTDPARTPETVAPYLSPDQRKLYTLIYNRFLATQMAPAVYRQRKVIVQAGDYTLEAAGSTLVFPGFLKLFPEPKKKDEQEIPSGLRQGEALKLVGIKKVQKFTEPPRRYSEAGLVNLLEKEGVGRPSTYASIISVIQERGYAVKERGSLRPTLLGQVVVDFLKRYFAETVEPKFTAHMEDDLDRIEEGTLTRLDALREFYAPFSARLSALESVLGNGGKRPFRVMSDLNCDKCGAPMELRYWKGTYFLGCSNYPECKNTVNLPPDLPYKYIDGKLIVREALAEYAAKDAQTIPCPECGAPMELRTGRYGRYYKCTNPECGKTAPVSTGVPCPKCGEGVLVEKYSTKTRRTFYSCSNYPKCRFAVSERPVKVCPSCGAGVLVEKGGKLKCTNKECGYEEPIEP